MNEQDIFLAAIEITDPTQRDTYLKQTCGDDAILRDQIEKLLQAYEKTSQFLETPAAATDSSVHQTILTDSSGAVDEEVAGRPGEEEFRKFLEPSSRPGWLGRLAHYEIEEVLGRGAFGIVAKAFDSKLHRVVAIKLMSPELATTSPPRKRFLREARTAAAVTHENIVAIYAVEEEPIPYLVMEYVSGKTLQQQMDEQGPLEIPEVLRIGRQVAAGLAAAHSVNLIHRFIKPSNILLSEGPNERAKISDFGLARAVDDASMTSSGLIAGTPMYMAPEQARGETLDHRADLFSLGSVLYQMTSGRPPFRAANTVAVLKRVCEDVPRSLVDVLPGIPDWLELIILRLLEKDREDRYQTAQEVADLLARCQSELENNGKVICVDGNSGTAKTQEFPAQKSLDSGAKQKRFGWLTGGVIAGVAVLAVMMIGLGPAPWFATTDDGRPAQPPSDEVSPNRHTTLTERELSEWVIEQGGTVEVTVNGQNRRVDASVLEELGETTYLVSRIDLTGIKSITDSDLARFFNHSSLNRLELTGTSITNDGIKQFAQHPAPRLEILMIGGNTSIDDGAIESLTRFPQLRVIMLNNRPITDQGVAALAEMKRLESLTLTATKITDASIRLLAELPNLKALMVGSTAISDAAVPVFAQMDQLEQLNVDVTRITPQAVQELQRALPDTEIQSISPTFGFGGPEVDRQVVEYLKKYSGKGESRVSILYEGDKYPQGISELRQEPFRVIGFHLKNEDLSDKIVEDMLKLPDLEWIEIQYEGVTDRQIERLLSHPTLTSFHLIGRKLTPEIIDKLTRRPSLTHLRVEGRASSSGQLRLLTKLKNLRFLGVTNTTAGDE
ncbi:MAG: protein kinase, partial [Planctomycetaceae bacterium]|nr:protein kinase [Planctomycetaceae bacterium]